MGTDNSNDRPSTRLRELKLEETETSSSQRGLHYPTCKVVSYEDLGYDEEQGVYIYDVTLEASELDYQVITSCHYNMSWVKGLGFPHRQIIENILFDQWLELPIMQKIVLRGFKSVWAVACPAQRLWPTTHLRSSTKNLLGSFMVGKRHPQEQPSLAGSCHSCVRLYKA